MNSLSTRAGNHPKIGSSLPRRIRIRHSRIRNGRRNGTRGIHGIRNGRRSVRIRIW
jgi:hypothetical protein